MSLLVNLGVEGDDSSAEVRTRLGNNFTFLP